MAKVFAYLRVSTEAQTTDNQRKEIIDCGFKIDQWFADEATSGTTTALSRPQFAAMTSTAERGDTIVIVKIDRIGRTASDTLSVISEMKQAGLKVVVLQLGMLDITSTAGKLMLAMLAAVAEMERDVLVERTNSGIARAKAEGKKFGRPFVITPAVMAQLCEDRSVGMGLKEIADKHSLQLSTVHRNIKEWEGKMEEYEEEYNAREAQYLLKRS